MHREREVGRGERLLRRQRVQDAVVAFKLAVAAGVQYGIDAMAAQHRQPALNGKPAAGAESSGGHHR